MYRNLKQKNEAVSFFISAIAAISLTLLTALAQAGPKDAVARGEGCLSCHKGIEVINQKMARAWGADRRCEICHSGQPFAATKLEAHGGLIANPDYFRGIYVVSGIWQQIGWGSIIYLAAISGIDQQQYESAHIDGANKFRMIWHITLPGIMPTVVILLILRIGNIMSVGWMKVLLLYSPLTYETADVISTYVYRKGITETFPWL